MTHHKTPTQHHRVVSRMIKGISRCLILTQLTSPDQLSSACRRDSQETTTAEPTLAGSRLESEKYQSSSTTIHTAVMMMQESEENQAKL